MIVKLIFYDAITTILVDATIHGIFHATDIAIFCHCDVVHVIYRVKYCRPLDYSLEISFFYIYKYNNILFYPTVEIKFINRNLLLFNTLDDSAKPAGHESIQFSISCRCLFLWHKGHMVIFYLLHLFHFSSFFFLAENGLLQCVRKLI